MRLRPGSLLLLAVGVWAVPIDRNEVEQEAKEEETGVSGAGFQVAAADGVAYTCSLLPLQDTGLYYDRYLREVIEVLETDPHFRQKLQTANTEDIKVSTPYLFHGCLQFVELHPSVIRGSRLVFVFRTDIWLKNWTW